MPGLHCSPALYSVANAKEAESTAGCRTASEGENAFLPVKQQQVIALFSIEQDNFLTEIHLIRI